MINIILTIKNKKIVKLNIYGHSGYDKIGKDIVCAAVSTLSQSIVLGCYNVINTNFKYNIDDIDSSLYIDISEYCEDDLNKAQILFQTFKYTIENLIVEYGKYIKFRIKEEQ